MRFAIVTTIVVSIFLTVGIAIIQGDLKQPSGKPANAPDEPKEIIGKDGAKMVLIPAGEFQMGTDPVDIPGLVQWVKKLYPDLDAGPDQFEDEMPRHTIYLDAFYMDIYEVTNAQYRKFVQTTGRKEPVCWVRSIAGSPGGTATISVTTLKPWSDENYNGDEQPVVGVDWEDAKAYAEWAGKCLPTEAEWEKAARGGLVGKRFPYGDDWPPPPKTGNFADERSEFRFTISGYDDGYAYTAPVGSFTPNGYGLYDMAGNVSEWCADWYDKDYYAKSPKGNPMGPGSGEQRVIRGGSWKPSANNLRAATRRGARPSGGGVDRGFRCVARN